MKEIVFLDFDGVIVDSIDECFLVSSEAYWGISGHPFEKNIFTKIFYENRGLVRPVSQYQSLHKAIECKLKGNSDTIENIFYSVDENFSSAQKEKYEKFFFAIRSIYKKDNLSWLNLHRLTTFGNFLSGKELKNHVIVTTKDRESVEMLSGFFNIKISEIISRDQYNTAGNKGDLISSFLNQHKDSTGIFVDDAVEHLQTVKDSRVTCFFADWGYGKNSDYPIYKF